MKLKTLKCPRCNSGLLRKERTIDPDPDDNGVSFDDTYVQRFRFVCGKCAFPGYPTAKYHEASLNSRWVRAVEDYKEGLYKGSAIIYQWERIPVKRHRHRVTPSASRDSKDTNELFEAIEKSQKRSSYGMHTEDGVES